ncbi:MAG: hypothetical protein QG671_1546, partial [Actinomycetota bacterium]|nr:hypothetical protein [Actinomycetota bacterium]
MDGSSKLSNEEWQKHLEFMNNRLEELRRDNVDSRTVCGRLERGWVRWSVDRRAQQRHLVRDIWEAESAGIPREANARFIGGIDSSDKLLALADPDFGVDPRDYFIVDAYWVEQSMTERGMALRIDGLSPMECSWLIREEACEVCERLAQLAFADGCNVIYLINTAYMVDGAEFMRERCGASDVQLRYGPPPDEKAGTIRAIIYRHLEDATPFAELVEALVTRWRNRPTKPDGPATWQEIFNRAEQRRDDDDLYWVSVAEDLGLLTVEETDAIFAAIESAAGSGGTDGADHTPSTTGDRWQYYRGRGLIFRVATSGTPHLEQYWGQRAGWLRVIPACMDWSDDPQNDRRYALVDDAVAATIQQHLDTQPGGVFRGGGFWFDRADGWTVERALGRAADLEAETKKIVMYWTWQEYQADLAELSRLRTFLEAAKAEQSAVQGDVAAMRELGILLATRWNPPELTKSREWLEKAAAAGDAEAMLKLGTLLADRWDPPDLEGARHWYERAAAAGNARAMLNLGFFFIEQWNPPDLTAARAWLEKSAEAGHTEAMINLGILLADRWDPPDLEGARHWYESAAAAGNPDAMSDVGVLLATRWDPPDLVTARDWLEKAALAG